jgi:hypothetical protein
MFIEALHQGRGAVYALLVAALTGGLIAFAIIRHYGHDHQDKARHPREES